MLSHDAVYEYFRNKYQNYIIAIIAVKNYEWLKMLQWYLFCFFHLYSY